MQYQVIQIEHSNRFWDVYTIKWIFDSFNPARELMKSLYDNYISYNKMSDDTNYDNTSWVSCTHLVEWENWWRTPDQTYKVVELDFEMNQPCEINISD